MAANVASCVNGMGELNDLNIRRCSFKRFKTLKPFN